MAASDYIEEVQSFYVAYYGRWADVAGLDYWTEALDAAGGDQSEIINAFGSSEEYLTNYADFLDAEGNITDPEGMINKVYLDLFDRPADDAGLAFYVDLLETGASTFPELVIDILNGATGTDQTIVDNKVAVAMDATEQLQANPDSVYGPEQIAGAQSILAAVGETPESVTAATAAASSFIQGNAPGEAFMLTPGVDEFTGTAANDTFNADLFESGADFFPTLQSVDSIDGGAGTNTLNLQLFGANGIGNNVALTDIVANVENWFVRNFDSSAGATLNLAGVEGVEQVWNQRSAGNLTLNNLAAAATIGMDNVADGTTYTIDYADDALGADAAAEQAILLNAVGDAEDNVAATLDVTTGGADAITTLTAAVTGDNVVALGAGLDGLENLVLNGAGALTLTANDGFVAVEDLDASGLVGTLDITVADAAVTATNSFVGGQATDDAFNVGDVTAVNLTGVSAFEVLGIGTAVDTTASAVTVDISGTDFTSLAFNAVVTLAVNDLILEGLADGGSVTFNDTVATGTGNLDLDTAGSVAVNFANDGGAANLVGFITGDDLTSLALDATETDQAVTLQGVTQLEQDTAQMSGLSVAVGAGAFDLGTLQLANLQTLTVNGSLTDDDGELIAGSFDAVIDGTSLVDNTTDNNPVANPLSTIDLSAYSAGDGAGGGSVATVDAAAANYAGTANVQVGEGDVAYLADLAANRREIIQFVGEDIGDADVDNFVVSSAGSGDKVDFSQFAEVTGLADLNIDYTGAQATITSNAFDGEIVITATGTIDQPFFEANAFTF